MAAPMQTVFFCVAHEDARRRVDAYLAQQMHWRSRRTLVDYLRSGAVVVNGWRVKKSHRLVPGDVVGLTVPASPDAQVDLSAITLSILYEDDELVVVNKPGDLAVHPASTCQFRNLLRRLEYYYAHERPDPRVQPSVIHRLDRTTSGVVAMVKHRALIAEYTQQFADRTPAKEYVAIVEGCLKDPIRIDRAIDTPPQRPVVVTASGKPSRTDVYPVAWTSRASRLSVILQTGRKHQIRAHLAAIGHPIVFDEVYGSPRASDWPPYARPLLHAARLSLNHRNGQRLCFTAAVPDDMEQAWQWLRADES